MDDFNYGLNWTRKLRIICPSIRKVAIFDLVCTLDVSTKLGLNIYDHKISDEFDYGSNQVRTTSYLPLNFEKLMNLT